MVLAYADGKITEKDGFEKPKRMDDRSVRYAPSFITVGSAKLKGIKLATTYPYTAESIARFLGWMI